MRTVPLLMQRRRVLVCGGVPSGVVTPWGGAAGNLVRRAVSGLLRVAAQLLGSSDEVTAMVLRSLQLLPKLHANVAWDLAEPLSAQVQLSI